MRTVQMTLDRALVEAVDSAARSLGTTRSAFARKALTEALERLRIEALEKRHRRGYERHPVRPDEFSGWEQEQAWPD
ncbi:MAG: ribbon-helix-helix domain-containing protein [Acidobacteria bacterium]|nr:ribbon-helix-helix domain-containing protein [Acidobacteriota bacterium]